MAEVRKYTGDRDPKSEAMHIEQQRMTREFAETKKKADLAAGKTDAGIQAIPKQTPSRPIGKYYGRRTEQLRGSPEGLVATIPDAKRVASYGTRPDDSSKGPGFFGEIARDDPEMFSSELSAAVTIDGKSQLIPMLVPTLTAEEIAHLVDGGQPTIDIIKKARDHAFERLDAGKSPFADFGEQVPLPPSANEQLRAGFEGKL
jgi:hypothetical protein